MNPKHQQDSLNLVVTKSRRPKKSGNKNANGSAIQVLHKCLKRHPNDPKSQIAYFAEHFQLIAATGRPRPVSDKTRRDFYDSLERGIGELRTLGMGVRNVSEIGRPHVMALLKGWIMDHQSAATMQTKLSFWRRFLTLIGKEHALPKGSALNELLASQGVDALNLSRQQTSVVSKSWSSAGVDFEAVLRNVQHICQITASQIEMQAAFGLRVSESIQIEPELSDMGDRLIIYRGTKGGKARVVYFDQEPALRDWQRDVLERAKVLARKHPKRRLSKMGKNLYSARTHYYSVLREVGVSKAELGVTSHGLRHEFAARKYEQMTGLRPQVEAMAPVHAYKAINELDHLARLNISQQLGHWRKDVTGAYMGSTGSLAREAKKRIAHWTQMIELNPAAQNALAQAGIERIWITGKAALGIPLSLHEHLQLMVQVRSISSMADAERMLQAVTQKLNAVVERGVSVGLLLGLQEPQDAIEIFIRNPAGRGPDSIREEL